MTASLAALASYISQVPKHWYLAFIGFFMLAVAALACIVFSYRCEKANLYLASLWRWFGAENHEPPSSFYEYSPKRKDLFREMCADEMNWVMVAGGLLIAVTFLLGR
jgi:hypothetical protein